MDRSLVQAKTSRSRSIKASDIGNGMMELTTCRMLPAACQCRLPVRMRGIQRAGSGSSGARLGALPLAIMWNASCARTLREASRGGIWPAVRPAATAGLSAIAFSTSRPTSKPIKRSIYR